MKYVFFDFNGTILDDLDLCLDLLNKILAKQGHKLRTKEEYKDLFCFPIRKYYELAGVDLVKDSYEELSKDFIKAYQPASFNCEIHDHLVEVVDKLKEKGITVGVLSASEINNLTEQLKVLNIYNKFDFVLGLNDIYAKSKVDVAKNYIKEHNINPKDILFVGDTDHDALVSDLLGSTALLYSKGHQSKNVLAKTNKKIIDDLIEVLNYID